jgi:hypothetical protein
MQARAAATRKGNQKKKGTAKQNAFRPNYRSQSDVSVVLPSTMPPNAPHGAATHAQMLPVKHHSVVDRAHQLNPQHAAYYQSRGWPNATARDVAKHTIQSNQHKARDKK